MIKLLLLSLFSFGLDAMEYQAAESVCDEEVAGTSVDEDLAATIVKDILTNAESCWLDEASCNRLGKDLSKK